MKAACHRAVVSYGECLVMSGDIFICYNWNVVVEVLVGAAGI